MIQFQRKLAIALLILFSITALNSFAHETEDLTYEEWPVDDFLPLGADIEQEILACNSASSRQLASVNEGNLKRKKFLKFCRTETEGSNWCIQVIRPNPSSRTIFSCTYGSNQVHQLIHPDEQTWDYAVQAIRLVERLQNTGICVSKIYNWWRPEPYNKNVGGAAGRHPYGTSVDVRFCSKPDQLEAFYELCHYRKQGEIRAIGYYGGTGLHFGIGDHNANTWGKSCPK